MYVWRGGGGGGLVSSCIELPARSMVLGSRRPISRMGSPQDESHIQNYFDTTEFRTQVTKSQACSMHCHNVKNQPSIYVCTIAHFFLGVTISVPSELTAST